MKSKEIQNQIGKWSAIFAILAAMVTGFAEITGGKTAILLVALGSIVGFLNVQKEEERNFLLATVALMLVGSAGLEKLPALGKYMTPIITNIATFAAPAALIIALKELFITTKT